MRSSKKDLMLLSTPSTASNLASTSAFPCTTVVEEEVVTPMSTPSSYCFVERDVAQRSPREAGAKLTKRHAFAELTRRKPQKEQVQPRPGTYVEQASVKHPLCKAPGPRTSVPQLSNYKRNSLWLNRKTKLLGVSTTDNAPPPLPERRDAMPMSPAPVLRIGSPMLLLPMDAQRRRKVHRRSIAQSPWQYPIVVDSNLASASSAPDNDIPRPTSPPKRISHRRSSCSTSISTSLSMYSQSSCAQPLQRPVSKVIEETDVNLDKVQEDLDANRDSMTPSAESGWRVASYHSTAQCVWKDTQWDFVPPTGVQEWVHFLESEDESEVVSSVFIEGTLPYLDSSSMTPTSTGGATYCADSPTPTLTSAGLQPTSKGDTHKRHYDKDEERASLLCLDYDYTAAIDQIVYGDHFNDDASSLELGRKAVPGPTPSHPQHSPEQQRPNFRAGHRARSSHSSYKTISRRPPSSKRGHRLSTSTSPRKEFVIEKGTHIPAASVLRHRSLSKSRRSSLRGGTTRRSPRPAMPGGFNLKSVAPLPAPSMAVSLSSPTPRTPAQRYQLEALSSGSRAAAVEGRVVTEQAPEAQTKAPGAHTGDKGRFGRLEGREDNPKSPTLKPKQKKSILFNVVHFFTKG